MMENHSSCSYKQEKEERLSVLTDYAARMAELENSCRRMAEMAEYI